jgi:hypothetical protein
MSAGHDQRNGCSEADRSPSPMPPATSQASRCAIPHLGILMAIMSSFFFSLSSLIVKLVPSVHPVALATYRFAGILLPSLPIVIQRAEDPFPRGKRLLLILRAFLGTTSLMSQFYALRHMPLADASVIIFSVPVFVAIFARIFLKVRPTEHLKVNVELHQAAFRPYRQGGKTSFHGIFRPFQNTCRFIDV